MRIFHDGEITKATTISGPYHNYLGLVFSNTNTLCEVVIEAVHLQSDHGQPERVDPERLRATVIDAIEQVNREQGSKLFVSKIQYVPTDSPRFETYAMLARAIGESKLKR